METTKITKQMIDFQKILFENSFNAVIVMQNHSENMINGFLKQFPWVTEETKKPFADSVSYLNKTRDEYKKNIDQGFGKLEELLCTKHDQDIKKEPAKIENTAAKETTDAQTATTGPKIKQVAKV